MESPEIYIKFKCLACSYVYDPEIGDMEQGIFPGTAFADIPEDWVCPVCDASKDAFEEMP
jgi:rubredoxin